MRVLIVNVNANTGSTGRIVQGLYSYLKQHDHSVRVCYRGAIETKVSSPDYIALCAKTTFSVSVFLSRLTGLEGHFSFYATKRLKRIVESYKPDLIQLYNIHGNYINSFSFLNYLKKKEIPVVYSMVDEYPYMGRCPYPVDCVKFMTECHRCPRIKEYPSSWTIDTTRYLFNKKRKIYDGFKRIVFTGPPYVCQRAGRSTLLKGKQVLELDEPFDFEEHYYPRDNEILRKQLGIDAGDRVIVCASGTSPRKMGKAFLDIARKLKTENGLRFIFIGYDRNDWVFPENVIVKGFISDQQDLASYLSLADAYVCTSVGDTTPSICLGALGCGTPLIGFNYGGVVDCAPNEFGTYVPIGDLDAMANEVRNCRKKTQTDIESIRAYAVGRFSPEEIYQKQVEMYKLMISK